MLFLWLRALAVKAQCQSAVFISGLATFIDAYRLQDLQLVGRCTPIPLLANVADPVLTGVSFNDAYRYMDWLLTVPLLLVEIVLVKKLGHCRHDHSLDSGEGR